MLRPDARRRGIYKKDLPYKMTGVKEYTPLLYLNSVYVIKFDVVWDILPDMMHIMLGIWKGHISKMMAGSRTPAKVKERKSWTQKENAQLKRDYEACLEQLNTWKLSENMGNAIDKRSRALGGEPRWIRNNCEVFSKPSVLKAHDWMLIIQQAGDYVLADLYPDNPRYMAALYALIAACNSCLTTISPVDSENREQMDQVKLKVIEALCKCESVLPKTELAVMFHILLHVPDCIYRWNSVRNFWCYFGERSSFLTIHNCVLNILDGMKYILLTNLLVNLLDNSPANLLLDIVDFISYMWHTLFCIFVEKCVPIYMIKINVLSVTLPADLLANLLANLLAESADCFVFPVYTIKTKCLSVYCRQICLLICWQIMLIIWFFCLCVTSVFVFYLIF